jgi:hypothetical protein
MERKIERKKNCIYTENGRTRTLSKPTALIGRSQEQEQRILSFRGPFPKDQVNGEIMVL